MGIPVCNHLQQIVKNGVSPTKSTVELQFFTLDCIHTQYGGTTRFAWLTSSIASRTPLRLHFQGIAFFIKNSHYACSKSREVPFHQVRLGLIEKRWESGQCCMSIGISVRFIEIDRFSALSERKSLFHVRLSAEAAACTTTCFKRTFYVHSSSALLVVDEQQKSQNKDGCFEPIKCVGWLMIIIIMASSHHFTG